MNQILPPTEQTCHRGTRPSYAQIGARGAGGAPCTSAHRPVEAAPQAPIQTFSLAAMWQLVRTTRNGGLDGTSAGVRGRLSETVSPMDRWARSPAWAMRTPPGNPGLGLIATISRTPRHRARSRASPLIVTDVGTWQTPAASEGGPAPMDPRCNAVRVSQRGPGPAVLSAEHGRPPPKATRLLKPQLACRGARRRSGGGR